MALVRQNNICPNCFYSPYKGGVCVCCKYTAAESGAMVLPYGVVLSDRYILGRLLGVGGFGVSYLAFDIGENKICAVKEYFPTTLAVRGNGGSVMYGGKGDRRVFDHGYLSFKREAEFMKKFKKEPLIVQMIDSFESNNTTYIAMEYLDGLNLKALLRGLGGKMPMAYAIEILLSVTEALNKIHSKGLIHRDISPENIFITKDGRKKIIDFGATREMNGRKDTAILVKPGFAPPEQYSSRGKQGPWTDIYALAATFYFAASGVKVPDARDREAGAQIETLDRLVPEAGTDLSIVIGKALSLDAGKRYSSAKEFYRALPVKSKAGDPGSRKSGMTGYIGKLSGVPYIMIERGSKEGEKWPIPQNIDIRVGRQSGVNNVVIFDKSVSREHIVIRYDSSSGLFVLKDVSTNGTFSDKGVRYGTGQTVNLTPGSRFFLAKDNIMMRAGIG